MTHILVVQFHLSEHIVCPTTSAVAMTAVMVHSDAALLIQNIFNWFYYLILCSTFNT